MCRMKVCWLARVGPDLHSAHSSVLYIEGLWVGRGLDHRFICPELIALPPTATLPNCIRQIVVARLALHSGREEPNSRRGRKGRGVKGRGGKGRGGAGSGGKGRDVEGERREVEWRGGDGEGTRGS